MQLITSAEQFREQARQHQEIARKLIEVADSLEGKTNGSPKRISGRRSRSGGKKLEVLKRYLLNNGPSTRIQIVEKAGLRPGTVAGLLNPDNGFERDENKLWYVKK